MEPPFCQHADALGDGVPDRLQRQIAGLDPAPTSLTHTEIERLLRDPFALLMRAGWLPRTARELLERLRPLGLTRDSYVVAEGGQIPWTPESADLERGLRIVVLWLRSAWALVSLVTAPPLDDSRAPLQVIAWDESNLAYNFYERRRDAWIWAGNSRHALSGPTHGAGPFRSHANGVVTMPALAAPWLHWSSEAAFELPGLAPDDPLRRESLFCERRGAEQLERAVRSSVHRWTRIRVEESLGADELRDPPGLLRHVVTATAVNLASSTQPSEVQPADGRLPLPRGLFVDPDLLDLLGLSSIAAPTIPWALYRRALVEFRFELRDRAGRLARVGDTHFAFAVPERALEDRAVLAELLRGPRPLLEPRLAACLLMVDFANPLFSPQRALLLRHAPAAGHLLGETWSIGHDLASAICGAATGGPELEFADLWAVGPAWRHAFRRRILGFFARLHALADRWDGVAALVRLAESHRRRLRGRARAAGGLALPVTAIPDGAPLLALREDGAVVEATSPWSEPCPKEHP